MNHHLMELRRAFEYTSRSAQLKTQTDNLAIHISLIKAQVDYLNARGGITPAEHVEIQLAFLYAAEEKKRLEDEAQTLTEELLKHLQ